MNECVLTSFNSFQPHFLAKVRTRVAYFLAKVNIFFTANKVFLLAIIKCFLYFIRGIVPWIGGVEMDYLEVPSMSLEKFMDVPDILKQISCDIFYNL